MIHHHHRHTPRCFCPAHIASFMLGGFAAGAPKAELSGAIESLSDITPKERSGFCNADRTATEGLYERARPGQAIVFRGANVLTMRDAQILKSHDVIARDGIIEAIRPTGESVPPDALIVAAEGKTLMPGLSDVHGHPYLATWGKSFAPMVKDAGDGSAYVLPYDLQMFQFLAAGVTRTEILAGCPDALWLRDSVRSGNLIGPRMRVASPIIDGTPPFHSPLMSYIVGDFEGGRRSVDIAAEMGYDFLKTYSRLPADGFEGVMQGCEAHGLEAIGHIPSAVDVEAALARGQHGVAHSSEIFYNETGPARTDEARRERIAHTIADKGTWFQATLIVTDRSERLMCEGPLPAPDQAMMNPLQKKMWLGGSSFSSSFKDREDLKAMFDDCYNLSALATRAVYQAGGRILTGTDSPNPCIVDGFSLHEEFEHLVNAAGMTRYDTLFATTRRAAEYHRERAENGTVVVGADADLLLLDANPLDDIRATRSVNTVLCGTALLRRDKIDEGLTRIHKAFDAMPPVEFQLQHFTTQESKESD